MESYKIENLTFKYPNTSNYALREVELLIKKGEFVTLCGKSGCGKSTLLRLLKPAIAPVGDIVGEIFFENTNINELDFKAQSEKIGFVSQNPDNQIVTDKVWHEMAFGLESLGFSTAEIRGRVAEIASFFGIQSWFHKKVTELSGGQKQLLNLASIMVVHPSVLILDEPTAQLDPIAAREFLSAVSKINRETGTTVILAEHRLEETFAISDRVIVMDNGKIIADSTPRKVGKLLVNHPMFDALPTPTRVFESISRDGVCPIDVRDGREWLAVTKVLNPDFYRNESSIFTEIAIKAKDLYFRYEKNLPDVIKGLSAEIYKGEFYAVLGGNGTGKTTFLSIISGLNKPYRGKIITEGKNIGVLPQNPQSLFVKKTVELDLKEISEDIKKVADLCEINDLLDRHPYDLSGGEQQRVALAKILLLNPEILLLDEPTKGLDAHFKSKLASILSSLKKSGTTIIMVSHDIEFCAKYADRCGMFFDGNIISEGTPREFFSGKTFYTTAANRMAQGIIPGAVLPEDIIMALGGKMKKMEEEKDNFFCNDDVKTEKEEKKNGFSFLRFFTGIIFAVLFASINYSFYNKFTDWRNTVVQILTLIIAGISISCFIPKNKKQEFSVQINPKKAKASKRTLFTALIILIAVPLTIFIGIFCFDDRKYYFISLLIILEIMVPFLMMFEKRQPKVREIVVISVICAIAVAGRTALYMLPQFKPVIALVIIAAVCFGGETGFLVGAITGFVSNFFLGQGPWTPWQMFSFGIIGFLAGILFKTGIIKKTKLSLCVFGGLVTIILYGGIMNPASVLMLTQKPTADMIITSYIMGLPFDLIHAASTVFFLWIAAIPMIEKLERVKIKYGFLG